MVPQPGNEAAEGLDVVEVCSMGREYGCGEEEDDRHVRPRRLDAPKRRCRFLFPSTIGAHVARQHRMRVGPRHLPPAQVRLVTNATHATESDRGVSSLGSLLIHASSYCSPRHRRGDLGRRRPDVGPDYTHVRLRRDHPRRDGHRRHGARRATPPTSAIVRGYIARVGSLAGQKAATEIDATGLYVDAGFRQHPLARDARKGCRAPRTCWCRGSRPRC